MLQQGFFSATGQPGALPADMYPLKGRAALPRPPSHGLKLEVRLFCTWHGEQTQTLQSRSMATSRRKSRGSPHHCATNARSPHQSGKGQGRGLGTKCHQRSWGQVLQQVQSTARLSCLGSSAQHGSPAGAAALRLLQPPGLRLLPQQIPPGENAATGAAAPCLWDWSREGHYPGL